jgi:putative salt-induced outer membrane protein YdiY
VCNTIDIEEKLMIVRIVILFLCLATTAAATVNTESLRQGLDSNGVAAEIAFSYDITKGNSDLLEFGLAPSMVWRYDRHHMFAINNVKVATSDDEDLINKGFLHLRYNLDLNRFLIYELFLQAQYDESQDLTARYLAGTGLRIIALDRSTVMLAAGITGMYEYEELDSGDIEQVGRSSNYISFRGILNDRAAVSATVYIQPRWSDADDIRVYAESNLEAKMSDHIALTTSANYWYDSNPPIGIKEYDLEISGGVKIRF